MHRDNFIKIINADELKTNRLYEDSGI